jgi:hypothetical protein
MRDDGIIGARLNTDLSPFAHDKAVQNSISVRRPLAMS